MKSNASTTVLVGMSGGVDSSVTAALLKEAGYRVLGLFMKNWDEKDPSGGCLASKEFEDVVSVCSRLEIPHYSVEFIQEYQERVFSQFLKGYEAGFTPNPDILCNREIKFDAFYEKALSFGADFLATGHYCQTEIRDGVPTLLKGLDPLKDQSYFLHAIDGSKLANVLFPVGALPKTEVRKIAGRLELSTKEKKDSTGICFIGERNFRSFLSQYLKTKRGEFRLLSGKKVGLHEGAPFYTLGQRKGLGLGGEGEPWFVVQKDMGQNIVYVERGESHPALYADELVASELTWIAGHAPGATFACHAKARYRQRDQECRVEIDSSGDETQALVRFREPQRALTPGQSVVFYQDDVCLGGGVIRRVGQDYFSRGLTLSDMALKLTPVITTAAEA